jgi:hypothetical protein
LGLIKNPIFVIHCNVLYGNAANHAVLTAWFCASLSSEENIICRGNVSPAAFDPQIKLPDKLVLFWAVPSPLQSLKVIMHAGCLPPLTATI